MSENISLNIFHELGIDFIFDKNEIELKKLVKEIYKNKYGEFVKQFGDLNFKSIPNKDFYDKYRKIQPKKSIFRKIFSR